MLTLRCLTTTTANHTSLVKSLGYLEHILLLRLLLLLTEHCGGDTVTLIHKQWLFLKLIYPSILHT